MPKKKDRSEVEWLRGQLRELTKINRQLKKRLKQLENQKNTYDNYISQDEEYSSDSEETTPQNIRPVIKYCSECGKGKLYTFELVGRMFEACDICEYRKKADGP